MIVEPFACHQEISEERQVTTFEHYDGTNQEVVFSHLTSLVTQSRFPSRLIETQISESTTVNITQRDVTKSVS